jgi:Fur family ferric uptake transcriptional regulator
MTETNPIVDALARAGCRLTAPRRAVADLIASYDGHFTAAELESLASERGLQIGRATLFRTLEMLIELRLLERVDLPSGEHAYVRCSPGQHHHHIICSRCGRTADVADPILAGAVADLGRQTGYRVDSHRLELFGLCPSCQTRLKRTA